MAENKPEESFKVVDRRLFTPEGELRREAVDNERREEEAAAKQAAIPATPSGLNSGATRGGVVAPAPAAPTAEAPAPSRGFQMLVNFLAQNAAALLGGYMDPNSGQAILDLDGAREMIDMLDALREKTRGNLAPEDDRLLLDVLGSLKLSFLEMSKAAAQAMNEKAKSKP